MPSFPTYFAPLTPPGRGAIAVIALFGERAIEILSNVFQPVSPKDWAAAAEGKAGHRNVFYGRWCSTGEDVVVMLVNDRVEVHCHGGRAAPQSIVDSLTDVGCLPAEPSMLGEWLYGSAWKAEIGQMFCRASTTRTSKILLAQFSRADQMLSELAEMKSQAVDRFSEQIKQIMSWAEFGFHLTRPWSVVLCGPPNVGKSSLINSLVGYERAIVHDLPGTTRDVVTQLAAVEGWPIELKDTAGLRVTDNPIEKRGIELAEAQIREADLVIAVLDVQQELNQECFDFVRSVNAQLVVRNKVDLLPIPDENLNRSGSELNEVWKQEFPDTAVLYTSTLKRINIDQLVREIAAKLVPTVPPMDMLIPVTEAHVEMLETM